MGALLRSSALVIASWMISEAFFCPSLPAGEKWKLSDVGIVRGAVEMSDVGCHHFIYIAAG